MAWPVLDPEGAVSAVVGFVPVGVVVGLGWAHAVVAGCAEAFGEGSCSGCDCLGGGWVAGVLHDGGELGGVEYLGVFEFCCVE